MKSDKVSLNSKHLARDARHLKRYVCSLALFVQCKFRFSCDPDRSLSFRCKTKPFCEIYLLLHEYGFFGNNIFFITGDLFLECAEKKCNSIFLNAMKWLLCNANIKMLSTISSITVNLHSDMHMYCFGRKY